jgi:hypothetical protein
MVLFMLLMLSLVSFMAASSRAFEKTASGAGEDPL